MKLIGSIAVLILSALFVNAQQWPTLKHYDQNHVSKIALPIGGIGTGTVSISGCGSLVDWEIMNRPGKGFSTVTPGNDAPFFAIHIEQGNEKYTKGLMGPLLDYEYEHMEGRPVDHHGIPRFEKASFDAAYPFGTVNLTDRKLPVDVKIKAFNPLIPGDADASGIPIAVLRYEVSNNSNEPLRVSVCGSIRNFIGKDGSKYHVDWKGDRIYDGAVKNKNEYFADGNLRGIKFLPGEVAEDDPAWGTLVLSTNAPTGVSYRTSSISNAWGNGVLDFWDDFSDDGELTEKEEQVDHDPMASLSVQQEIPANSTREFEFYLTWHFPNRKAWASEVVGNYYTTQYKDALDVIQETQPKLKQLEAQTLQFVNAFLNTDLPEVVKESALFNLSTLRSQTVFRIKSGHMMGWEGCMDRFGSCAGSCTHVWNYEQATAFLFGNLALTMRDVEFNYATRDNGSMSFRAGLPLISAQSGGVAADGQMGTIMKMYRDWQLSGNTEFVRKSWTNVKSALAFAWEENSWDADANGVMEGSQHNTMDVNYSGPNPQMQFWYLGALKAAEQMALAMDDKTFAKKCAAIYKTGSEWTDKNLFNGEYYVHQVLDPETKEEITDYSAPNMPKYQLAKGCLVDQLVGQYMAHICGLGYLAPKEHIKTTFESILKYNRRESMTEHFNNMRSYALGNESALLMASWPNGRPKIPFPYFSEVMTGFEYAALVGMIYEGMEDEGVNGIKNIRDRYDGAKRSPFDEAECGHHYARAMASWASVLALNGFEYSAVDKTMKMAARPGKWFWSNGYSWGTADISEKGSTIQVELVVLHGNIELKYFELKETGIFKVETQSNLKEGDKFQFEI
ncbi:GH116 family glycosyl-hydrolase [Sunxiuqinia sp. sy24]|uniref:GH116 family glycosyl-hydrolase n=1 Tax=Sunxiuqinia sp. sy24 TaxID=3461495 RepID=UPI004045FFFC